MSAKHPIIAVTCSSGTGTTSVTRSFNWIQSREHINAVVVEGDSLHRYNRADMRVKMAEAAARGNHPARIIEKDDYRYRPHDDGSSCSLDNLVRTAVAQTRSDCARHGRTKTPETKRDLGSASIAIYRPQAEVFGGRSDGKFGIPSVEVSLFQVLRSAGDN